MGIPPGVADVPRGRRSRAVRFLHALGSWLGFPMAPGCARERRASYAWLLLGVSLLGMRAGCAAAQFAVRVRVPSDVDPAGIDVRLVSRPDLACGATLLAQGRTDATGEQRMQLETCGPAWLVVSQRGLRTQKRRVDTCHLSFLELQMSAEPPPPASEDLASSIARRFLSALAREDWDAVAELLAVPGDVELYHTSGIQRRSAASRRPVYPWRTEVISTRHKAWMNDVTVALDYDDGCRSTWLVVLLGSPKQWRVALLQPMSEAQLLTAR